MKQIPISVGNKNYTYFLGDGYFGKIREVLRPFIGGRHVLVISQKPVGELYMGSVVESLQGLALKVSALLMPPGEAGKNLHTIENLANKSLHLGVDRSSVIVALGGGVVGDTAGFLASVYMRGIDYIQVPTTLLAMVDSSIGGKVAVNVSGGKNIIGAFHQPLAVFADISLLKSLAEGEFRNALSEVIKYGAGFDREFLDWTENNIEKLIERDPKCLMQAVEKCVRLKAAVIERDERDLGQRMLLNLGHTLAHAVEKKWSYCKYSHGQAVGMGLVFAFLLAKRLGRVSPWEVERVIRLVKKAQLPLRPEGLGFEEFWEIVKGDKKWRGGANVFILPYGIGRCSAVYNIDERVVRMAYNDMLQGL